MYVFFYWLSMLHYTWVILHAISHVVSYHGVVLYFTHAWIHGICYSNSKSMDSKRLEMSPGAS
jgi:hypothetical protein